MNRHPKEGALTTAPAPPADAKPYEATAHERAAAQRTVDRRLKRAPAPKFVVKYEGAAVALKADHADAACNAILLADALGTGDVAFADGILVQLLNAARTGKEVTSKDLNFILATVTGIAPRDPTEALLAAQMAAIHNATMIAARRLNHTETVAQQDLASNMFNKLARTFVAQVEALKRYRSSGEQTVRVTHQHVSVTASQAVVGINPGGGGANENSSQSHAPSRSDESKPAMLCQEQAIGLPLPSASSEGPESVPNARGKGGSTEREG